MYHGTSSQTQICSTEIHGRRVEQAVMHLLHVFGGLCGGQVPRACPAPGAVARKHHRANAAERQLHTTLLCEQRRDGNRAAQTWPTIGLAAVLQGVCAVEGTRSALAAVLQR